MQAEHFVRGVRLHSAGDLEARLGADARFYLLDLARAFPPEVRLRFCLPGCAVPVAAAVWSRTAFVSSLFVDCLVLRVVVA